MPCYYIWTIGCQMNQAESERLEAYLASLGYEPSASADAANVVIINSCVVRKHAEEKVINKLYNLKALKKARPEMTLALTGCLVGPENGELNRRFPYVDHLFRPGEMPDWLEGKPLLVLPQKPAVSTLVPIIHGCNNFCSYCIVPYRRGREKSHPLPEIVCEVRELARRGSKEVILLGQNVDSYGHDLPGNPDLADLLTELNEIDGILRIRFLTNHPKDMSHKLIDALAGLNKVCEQLSLPIQAGDDAILQTMGRGYSVEHFRELVAELRSRIPEIALSTDVIVGFPGETEEQFQATLNLLAELRFDSVHIAAYSPRPGTLAARKYVDDIPPEVKKARLAAVEKLQEQIAGEINAQLLSQTVEVLVDDINKGRWQGRSRSDKLVFFNGDADLIGKLVKVVIEKSSPWSLQGSLK